MILHLKHCTLIVLLRYTHYAALVLVAHAIQPGAIINIEDVDRTV